MEVRKEYRNTMTDIEILESLKCYTAKPEILDRAIKSLTAIEGVKTELERYDKLGEGLIYVSGVLKIINRHYGVDK